MTRSGNEYRQVPWSVKREAISGFMSSVFSLLILLSYMLLDCVRPFSSCTWVNLLHELVVTDDGLFFGSEVIRLIGTLAWNSCYGRE